MTDIDDFREKIKNTISKLKKKLNNAPKDEKKDLVMRIEYLEFLQKQYEQENRLREPKVFVSFSGKDGEELMVRVLRALHQTESFPRAPNFDVVKGMKGDGPTEVLDFIRERMQLCYIFLGILTEKYTLDHIDEGGKKYVPAAWILIEAGMAIGLGLRCVFLAESNIHKRFWFDIIGGWRQVKFDKQNFDLRLEVAIKRIKKHYEELRKSFNIYQ